MRVQLTRQDSQRLLSNRHHAHFFFHLSRLNHNDGIPRATVEEAAIWPFAEAFLAADTKQRIDLDAPKGRMVFIRHPEHTVFDGTILDAGWRAGTTRAALGDDGEFFGLFLSRCSKALGSGLRFQFVRNQSDSFGRSGRR